jgi:hypothetical protein
MGIVEFGLCVNVYNVWSFGGTRCYGRGYGIWDSRHGYGKALHGWLVAINGVMLSVVHYTNIISLVHAIVRHAYAHHIF